MADRICIMEKGEILQIGPPVEVYEKPATKFVAGFIGSPAMNFLAAQGGLAPGASEIRVNGDRPSPCPVCTSRSRERKRYSAPVRSISVSATTGRCAGGSIGVEYMGARQIVTVDTDAGPAQGACQGANTVKVDYGDTVGLTFDADKLLVFDPETDRALESDLVPGRLAMAEVRTSRRHQAVRATSPPSPTSTLEVADGGVRRPARAHRRRQDDDLAPHRRARTARSGIAS